MAKHANDTSALEQGPGVPSLLPDQPISAAGQDQLGRRDFALQLSQQLLDYDDPSCLVIALYSPWGSGKSSLLNLLGGELTAAGDKDEHSPIVVRFDPWNFSGLDQLIAMFFRELEIGVGREENQIAKNIGRALRVLSMVLPPGELSPAGGSYIKMASQAAKGIADEIQETKESLVQIKARVNEELHQFQRWIFVLIDDIDRLDKDSVRLMFRLIRLNADFDKVTYVLAFDRAVVESVLSEEQGVSGSDYLEKIVQVGFDIPPPEPRRLKRMFLEALESFDLPIDRSQEDLARWVDLQAGALDKLIRTPRDVVRYINGLRINGGIVSGEVNPVDFAGIEAIRTFAPSLYAFIRDNRDIFVGQAGGAVIITGHDSRTEDQQRFDAAIVSCAPESQGALREICEQLFPEVETLYKGVTFAGSFYEGWRQAKQICTVDFFPRYFYLRPAEDEVSEAELQSIIQEGRDRTKMVGRLEDLIVTGRMDSFAERLADAAGDFAQERVESTVIALFDVGDRLKAPLLRDNQLLKVSRAVHKLLGRQDEIARFDTLRHAAEDARSLGALVYYVNLYGTDRPHDKELLPQTRWAEIRGTLLSRIRAASRDGTLSKLPLLATVLFRWRDWESVKQPGKFVSELCKSDKGILEFLEGMLARQSRTVGKYAASHGWYVPLEGIQELVDPATLVGRVQQLKEANLDYLTERQQTAVDAFLTAMEPGEE